MPNLAHILPTDRELRQSIWCLPEGMVMWQGLLHRGLTVQVVPGQCLYHAGPISYHGHHLFLRYGKVQILPLQHQVTDFFLRTLSISAYAPKRDHLLARFPCGWSHGHRCVLQTARHNFFVLSSLSSHS